MTSLLVFKDKMKEFYGQNDIYIRPFMKFLLAFFAMLFLHMATGYLDILGSPAVMLVLALACAFLPNNLMVIVLLVYILGEMYSVSMEAAAVLFICFVIMYLLYFKFSPKDSLVLILMPVSLVFNFPFLIPVLVGVFMTPFSVVAVVFGTFIFYAVDFIRVNSSALTKGGEEEIAKNLSIYINGILKNDSMYAIMLVLAVTVVIVYIIRKLRITNSNLYAVGTGSVVQMIGFIMVRMLVDSSLSLASIIVMSVLSGLIASMISFLILPLDYSRTENVQYEDDDYYYYVKAVPKYKVTKPEVRVKRINARRERQVKQRKPPERNVRRNTNR